jgi:peptidoglycan hydrolase CwlO-like protein
MKEILTNTLLVIVAGLIIYSIMVTTTIKTDVGVHYRKINKIESKIDSAKYLNKQRDLRLAKLDSNISIINDQIQNVENNINIIKKRTDENVASVDTFSHSQLEQFFTKRYNPNISK